VTPAGRIFATGFFFMLHLNVVIAELKGMVRHDLLAAHMPDSHGHCACHRKQLHRTAEHDPI
jgi:hypothetical protein